jgi:hypothetical protein
MGFGRARPTSGCIATAASREESSHPGSQSEVQPKAEVNGSDEG